MPGRVLKWVGIIGPGLIAGLFETIRHGYFDDRLPTVYGNIATMVLVIIASGLLLSHVFHALNAREKALHVAEARNSILNERERIARDLHDSISQSVFYLNIKIKELEQHLDRNGPSALLVEIDDVMARLYHDVRQTIFELKATEQLGDAKFTAALRQYFSDFQSRFNIEIRVRALEHTCKEDCPESELEMFRIIQEVLINAWRHGDVDAVEFFLESDAESDRLIVSDDGKGFDLTKVPGVEEGHFGLSVILERAIKLGGRLTVNTAPGEGTTVTFWRHTTKDV